MLQYVLNMLAVARQSAGCRLTIDKVGESITPQHDQLVGSITKAGAYCQS
jgi:hypothetical protein